MQTPIAEHPASAARRHGASPAAEKTASQGGYDPAWFDVLAEVEERHFWFRARNGVIATAVRRLLPELGPSPRLLEVGCGNGYVLKMLREICPGAKLTGMDLFQEGLEHARQRCHCTLVPGDILNAPFADGSFDLIGMFDVLEHLPDDRRALGALWSLLAPGGGVVLTVPACRALWSYFDEIGGHYRRYERAGLASRFVECGFEVSYITHFMTTLFPLVWMARRNGRPGREHADSVRRAKNELRIRPLTNELLRRLLGWERWWLASRRRLPVGTSLLVIARKPAAGGNRARS